MGDQVAMILAAPTEVDVTMADAAPVLEIAKDVAGEHDDVGNGNGNGNGIAVCLPDCQVQPSVGDVIVEDLIVEDVIGQCRHFLADNYAESC